MANYIDVHAHLTGEEYESVGGVEAVLERARAAGVTRVICSGYDLPSSYQAAALAEKYEGVYFTAGFQPEEIEDVDESEVDGLKPLLSHEKCVGVGELGLDYHFPDNPSAEKQKAFFVRQLTLADEAGLPVVIHSRDACADTLELLEKYRDKLKAGFLMHCYSYSAECVREFSKLGGYFSFGGTSTFKNAKKVKEAAKLVAAERILTETDCPYLTPEPYRGRFPNEPKNVKHVLENLAVLREENEEELKTRVCKNAETLFFKLK